MNNGFSKIDTYVEKKNVTTFKSSETSMSSPEALAFLHPCTQQALEEHVRLWVRHMWRLPLKVLRIITYFKLKKVSFLPLRLSSQSSSTPTISEASSECDVVALPGKPSQTYLEEAVIDEPSSSSLESILLSSSSSKELDTALIGIPFTSHHRPLETLFNRLQNRQPSENFTHIIRDRSCQNMTVIDTIKEKQEDPLPPREDIAKDPGAQSLQIEVISESQYIEEMGAAEEPATDVLLPDCSTAADTLASQVVDNVVADGDNRQEKQKKLGIMKDRDLLVGQKKTLAFSFHSRREKLNIRKYEERPKEPRTYKVTQVRKTEPTFGSKQHQSLPQNERVSQASSLHRLWKRFLQWILPRRKIKGQGEPLKKSKPTSGITQTQRQVEKRSPKDSDITEVQGFVTDVGQRPEKKMPLQCKPPAFRFNQQREGLLLSRFLGTPAAKGLPLSPNKGRFAGGPIPRVRIISFRKSESETNSALKV